MAKASVVPTDVTGPDPGAPTPAYVPPATVKGTTGGTYAAYSGPRNTGGTPLDVTANDLYGKAGGVIGNQLSGNAYSPFALQTQQALGRAEANQRMRAASAIHSAGFSGTPLGAAAGNATEAELLRNRFDANLGIETERQKLMNIGVDNTFKYGDAANKFQSDQSDKAQYELSQAHSNASGLLMSSPILQEEIRTLSPAEGVAKVDAWLKDNPQAQQYFARIFGREFTAEDVYDYNTNMLYTTSVINTLANALTPPGGNPADNYDVARDAVLGFLEIRVDKDGDYTLAPSGATVPQNLTNPAGIGGANNAANNSANSGFEYLNGVNNNINNQVNNQVNNAMQNVNIPNLSTPNNFDINNLYTQPTYWGGGSSMPNYRI